MLKLPYGHVQLSGHGLQTVSAMSEHSLTGYEPEGHVEHGLGVITPEYSPEQYMLGGHLERMQSLKGVQFSKGYWPANIVLQLRDGPEPGRQYCFGGHAAHCKL
jgi:hypothetical protein